MILDCYKDHEYYTNDSFESIWVHFSGSNCLNIYHEIERVVGNTVCCRNPQLIDEVLFNIFDGIRGEKTVTEYAMSMYCIGCLWSCSALKGHPKIRRNATTH